MDQLEDLEEKLDDIYMEIATQKLKLGAARKHAKEVGAKSEKSYGYEKCAKYVSGALEKIASKKAM